MFKVVSVAIDGFWKTSFASSEFRDDVNIIIGRNGTGKTTFMNILHALLAVDVEELYENYFRSAVVMLSDGKRKRTIKANRIDSDGGGSLPYIEYLISNRKFVTPLIGSDDGRALPPSIRRRAIEEAQKIKRELEQLVSVASLSVYRIGGDPDPEARDRYPRRYSSTVDARLNSLMQGLTQYQLELSNRAREVSSGLQRDVLVSLLYSDKDEIGKTDARSILAFDETAEKQKLVSAFKQLNVSGSEVAKKIAEHVVSVSKTVTLMKQIAQTTGKSDAERSSALEKIDLSALEAFRRSSKVVELSLDAEDRTKQIFSQIDLFLQVLHSFIPDKTFAFSSGVLTVSSRQEIPLSKLSSGEKQLLILFIEALLQRQRPFVFLADEPELSLHISWQRNILSAIRSLNPTAQIIVATHSPEIAGKFRTAILHMENILHG